MGNKVVNFRHKVPVENNNVIHLNTIISNLFMLGNDQILLSLLKPLRRVLSLSLLSRYVDFRHFL